MLKPALSFVASCVSLAALSFVDAPALIQWCGADGMPLDWTSVMDCPHCCGIARMEKYDPNGHFVCNICGDTFPASDGFKYMQKMREKAVARADVTGTPFEGFDEIR